MVYTAICTFAIAGVGYTFDGVRVYIHIYNVWTILWKLNEEKKLANCNGKIAEEQLAKRIKSWNCDQKW